jgi:hypothetical protein
MAGGSSELDLAAALLSALHPTDGSEERTRQRLELLREFSPGIVKNLRHSLATAKDCVSAITATKVRLVFAVRCIETLMQEIVAHGDTEDDRNELQELLPVEHFHAFRTQHLSTWFDCAATFKNWNTNYYGRYWKLATTTKECEEWMDLCQDWCSNITVRKMKAAAKFDAHVREKLSPGKFPVGYYREYIFTADVFDSKVDGILEGPCGCALRGGRASER